MWTESLSGLRCFSSRRRLDLQNMFRRTRSSYSSLRGCGCNLRRRTWRNVLMSQMQRRRRIGVVPFESTSEFDMERVFGQLFPQPTVRPPRRNLRRVVREGDGTTTAVDYSVRIDPQTGDQRVDVRVLTNKIECSRCGRLVSPSKLYKCDDCSKMVCGTCFTSRSGFLWGRSVCLTCAYLRH